MLKLIAFAHAGGSVSALLPIGQKLARVVEFLPQELPGRGVRRREPLHHDRGKLVKQLCAELAPRLAHEREPYALFGHSLGATIAFELAHALIARGVRAPSMLFAAAAPAPSTRPERYEAAHMSDEELQAELRRLGGTPAEVFEHPQLLELCLPIVRADFQLCDGASPSGLPPLPCPIHVFAGRSDRYDEGQLLAWQHETTHKLSLCWFDGGHFFVRSHCQQLCAAMVARIADARLAKLTAAALPLAAHGGG